MTGIRCRRVSPLDVAVFAAFVGMGLGSWIAVNGIFQELPLISLTAPPAYNISVIESYAALLVAGANACVRAHGPSPLFHSVSLPLPLSSHSLRSFLTRCRYPVLYLVVLNYAPCLRGNGQRQLCVDRWTLVAMMLVLGAGSCGLLAAFWGFADSAGALLFFFLIFQVGLLVRAHEKEGRGGFFFFYGCIALHPHNDSSPSSAAPLLDSCVACACVCVRVRARVRACPAGWDGVQASSERASGPGSAPQHFHHRDAEPGRASSASPPHRGQACPSSFGIITSVHPRVCPPSSRGKNE